jgi:hypothetical protein
MQKWEYLYIDIVGDAVYSINNVYQQKPEDLAPYLFQKGKEGWELVSSTQANIYQSDHYTNIRLFFKRILDTPSK